jgi:mono/diheme cytochrome c family protein
MSYFSTRASVLVGFVGLAMGLSACADASSTREWTPDDHAQPSGSVDPSRLVAPAPSVTAETARERALVALYQAHCASCHGAEGRGDGAARSPMMQLPDFGAPAFHAERDDAALVRSITEGKGLMPAFGEAITAENIEGLVARVRAFAPPPSAATP